MGVYEGYAGVYVALQEYTGRYGSLDEYEWWVGMGTCVYGYMRICTFLWQPMGATGIEHKHP